MISVIMSTYREEEKFLRKAISSILDQTYADFEFLIAVDDPQNTALIAVLQEYAARDTRIRLHINEENMGLSASLNILLQEAQGNFVARMDADDISMPKRLEKQIAYMKEHQVDIISCDVDVIDENDATIQKMTNLPSSDVKIKKKLCINNCLPVNTITYCRNNIFIFRPLIVAEIKHNTTIIRSRHIIAGIIFCILKTLCIFRI